MKNRDKNKRNENGFREFIYAALLGFDGHSVEVLRNF